MYREHLDLLSLICHCWAALTPCSHFLSFIHLTLYQLFILLNLIKSLLRNTCWLGFGFGLGWGFFSGKLSIKLNWIEKQDVNHVLRFISDILHTGRSQIETDLWCQMWFLSARLDPAWACQRAKPVSPQAAVERALIRCIRFIIQKAQPMKCSWHFPYPLPIPQPSHTWWFPP